MRGVVRTAVVMLLLAGTMLGTGCSPAGGGDGGARETMTGATGQPGDRGGVRVTVYQQPACQCCGKYQTYLRDNGFEVETVYVTNMVSLKRGYNIPQEIASCHTMLIEGRDYFVEGHVPVAAVYKMLEEKPDIDGIALPGMPTDSPGMDGVQSGPLKIYAVSGGTVTGYTSIAAE